MLTGGEKQSQGLLQDILSKTGVLICVVYNAGDAEAH